jgi:signal transduction histidine kinase
VEDLLSHVLERTMRAVSASIGSIMILDQEKQTLRIAVGRGLRDQPGTPVEIKVGEGIAGRVAQLGEPVLVEDIDTDPRFARPNDPKYGSGSFICMPLRVSDRVVGVVNLAKKEIRPGTPVAFTPTDLQFLNALATYTAYAVDNARLFEQAQLAARKLQDVVEDQKLRLTLAQQQMIQAAKLSAMGELVAGVAHELNNPLTVLVGVSQLLERNAPESLQKQVKLIRDAVDVARNVVHGLLAFGRRMPMERTPTNMDDLLESVLALSAADLRFHSVKVEKAVEPDLPLVWVDGNQIRQVILNVINNAKQAMAERDGGERTLTISLLRTPPDRVQLRLEDTGPGIPADVLPTIFDPFVTTKGNNGTGLGLSISYGIIGEHGGFIGAESPPGRGAIFTIELPIGAADSNPATLVASL